MSLHDEMARIAPNLTAFLILHKPTASPAGIIKIRHSQTGMTHTCYLHIYGHPPVKGRAGGCGYDVIGAAIQQATRQLPPPVHNKDPELTQILSKIDYSGNYSTVFQDTDYLLVRVN